jgi:hypothetical protein
MSGTAGTGMSIANGSINYTDFSSKTALPQILPASAGGETYKYENKMQGGRRRRTGGRRRRTGGRRRGSRKNRTRDSRR